jgi:FixJ family two-component response regulator
MENSAAGPMHLSSGFVAHPGNGSTCPGTLLHEAFSVLPKTRDEKSMTDTRLLVSVVDDDESVRESLPDLLKEFGFAGRAFSSAEEFLESHTALQTGCLLLDIAMPGMRGPELHLELTRRGINIPVIFITAHRDEAMRRHILEQGAVECLLKPFSDTALLDALNAALRVK